MCHDVRGVMTQLRSQAGPHPLSRPSGWSEKLGVHVSGGGAHGGRGPGRGPGTPGGVALPVGSGHPASAAFSLFFASSWVQTDQLVPPQALFTCSQLLLWVIRVLA